MSFSSFLKHNNAFGRFLAKFQPRVFLAILGVLVFAGTIYATGGGLKISSPPSAAAKGMVGYWPLSQDTLKSATKFADLTPNGNTGTSANTPTFTSDYKSKANGAMSFNGSSDYVKISGSDRIGVSAATFCAWIYSVSLGAATFNYNGIVENGKFRLYQVYTGKLRFTSDGGTANLDTTGGSISINKWYFVCVTRDVSGNANFYLNGTLNNSGSSGTPAAATINLYIGQNTPQGNNWNGFIADVRIYNYVLTQSEITQLYDAYKPKISLGSQNKGLVGYWPLDSASMKSSSTTADLTPNGNKGTLYGRALANRLTTDRKSVANGAMSFNGITDYVDVGNQASLNINNAITITAWIKTSSSTKDWEEIVGDSNAQEIKRKYNLLLRSGVLNFYHGDGVNSERKSPNINIADGLWKHVAFTASGTSGTFYINGVPYSTTLTYIITGGIGSNIEFGNKYGTVATGFDGSIADVRIYNYALSQSEITKLYDAYKPKISLGSQNKGMVGYWPLDSASMKSSSTTADLTPQGNDGTLYGRALANRLTTDRKEVANGAMSFNGIRTTQDLVKVGMSSFSGSQGSISAWAKSNETSPPVDRFFVARNLTGNNAGDIGLFFSQAQSKTEFFIQNGVNTSMALSNSTVDGLWHHYVGTWNSTETALYVDGVKQTTTGAGISLAAHASRTFGIGAASGEGDWNDGPYWNGSIADVRIYNRALSADEVQVLYEKY